MPGNDMWFKRARLRLSIVGSCDSSALHVNTSCIQSCTQFAGRPVQVVNCGDDNARGKPAPDCFKATAGDMGVDPSACLVFEDAPAGVEAASLAGMRVIAIPSLLDKAAYPTPDPDCRTGKPHELLAVHAQADTTEKFKSYFGSRFSYAAAAVQAASCTMRRSSHPCRCQLVVLFFSDHLDPYIFFTHISDNCHPRILISELPQASCPAAVHVLHVILRPCTLTAALSMPGFKARLSTRSSAAPNAWSLYWLGILVSHWSV